MKKFTYEYNDHIVYADNMKEAVEELEHLGLTNIDINEVHLINYN